eukprot:scaffold232468_cov29-Tisochrysis_lutea.AAC.4
MRQCTGQAHGDLGLRWMSSGRQLQRSQFGGGARVKDEVLRRLSRLSKRLHCLSQNAPLHRAGQLASAGQPWPMSGRAAALALARG